MSDYRRRFIPGATYFFTLVTYGRRPILTTELARSLLRLAIIKIRLKYPFTLFATVLLPDHWHWVMQLPAGDSNYSTRVRRIKEQFTRSWLKHSSSEAMVTKSQATNHERGIWQPRFWEHTVRDEGDLEGCVDYIHWNPRKHQLVERVSDWPWSSFHRFVAACQYDPRRGGVMPESIEPNSEWGEP